MRKGAVDLRDLLKIFREQTGLSVTQVAAQIGSSASRVSNWEAGHRRPDQESLKTLDGLYSAGGALIDLAAALGTPEGLPARRWWGHNFQPPSSPVWLWIRPGPGSERITAEVQGGPFLHHLSEPWGSAGGFVVARTSVTNPGVQVRMDHPGWVDFGRGEVPAGLHLPIRSATESVTIEPRSDGWLRRIGAMLAEQLQLLTRGGRLEGGALLGLLVVWRSTVPRQEVDAPADESAIESFDGAQFRSLRAARGLSRSDAATAASLLNPPTVVTERQLVHFENNGRPTIPDLLPRLDTVLRADGAACVCRVPVRDAPGGRVCMIDFPPYWVGPIWVQFRRRNPGGRANAELEWAPWIKPLTVVDGAVVTTRRSSPSQGPLLVSVPDGWRVVGGVGRRADAVDVNHEWAFRPRRPDATFFATYLRAFLKAHRRADSSTSDLHAF